MHVPTIFDPNTEWDLNKYKVTSIIQSCCDNSYANISVDIFDILLSETNEQQRKQTNEFSKRLQRKKSTERSKLNEYYFE